MNFGFTFASRKLLGMSVRRVAAQQIIDNHKVAITKIKVPG
jgi:hypothetical protein